MGKKFTLVFMLILLYSTFTCAQDQNDVSRILIKCISLPELQKFIPSGSPVYVLQHGISFPAGTDVSRSDKEVFFVNKAQLESLSIKSYFLFWEFNIEMNTANIDYVFNYPGKDGKEAIQRVILRLQKEGQTWNIVNIKIAEG